MHSEFKLFPKPPIFLFKLSGEGGGVKIVGPMSEFHDIVHVLTCMHFFLIAVLVEMFAATSGAHSVICHEA